MEQRFLCSSSTTNTLLEPAVDRWPHNHTAPQFLHQICTVVPNAMVSVLASNAKTNGAFDVKVLETFVYVLNYEYC